VAAPESRSGGAPVHCVRRRDGDPFLIHRSVSRYKHEGAVIALGKTVSDAPSSYNISNRL